ncbi:MAG TPA: SDR family oxidoreductase [Levilinea sp.]|nr:SDR family oxidoreductase [Levilinea sp.]
MPTIFDKFSLKGQVALVTGGAGLLGKQFSRTLAEAGAQVVVADIDKASAQAVAQEISHDGYEATGLSVNVTSVESTRSMVAETLLAFGRLDVLVCSAALDPKFEPQHQGLYSNAFEDYPLQAWKDGLDVNLTGMFLSVQSGVKPMLAANRGSIVLICSTYGLVGPDQRIYEREGQPKQYKPVFYSVTKAGVLGLTRYLATYYAGTRIRANALTPGGVYNNHDEGFVRSYAARTVMGRMANQDEMNGALLFLASDASSYMTGGNLIVDGGWTAW